MRGEVMLDSNKLIAAGSQNGASIYDILRFLTIIAVKTNQVASVS
jgi:hypothetical protein